MALTRPWALGARFFADPQYARTWFEDLRYMGACSYFSSRTKPDYKRLARFSRQSSFTLKRAVPAPGTA
jgi:hypothetical protein